MDDRIPTEQSGVHSGAQSGGHSGAQSSAQSGAQSGARSGGVTRDQLDALIAERDDAREDARKIGAFLAGISHEIRTPMNGVLGMAELMLGTALTPAQRDYAQSILYSTETLLKLVDDLLDLTKIDSGKLVLETVPFDLYRLAGDVVDLFAPQADAKGLRLAYDVAPNLPSAVVGDPLRVRQILTNLVSNAVKFTSEGHVVVRLESARSTDGRILIRATVEDTGIGIAEERQHLLFEAYHQIEDDTARKFGGTGLGLAISHQLVEAMGGRIDVRSTLDAGSSFSVEIDFGTSGDGQECAMPEEVPQEVHEKVSEEALEGIEILLVDGPPPLRHILTSYLATWNMSVLEADSGEEAIRLARRHPVRIALIGTSLDGMPSAELARQLTSQGETAPRLILLTDFKDRTLTEDLRAAGFDACVGQPIWPHRLRSALVAVLSEDAGAASEDASVSPDSSGHRILLVEDNVTNQRVASAILERLGYETVVASDGPDALEALQCQWFDVILMDCQMPGMDGFETTQRIRELTGDQARIPIVALTANALKGDRERCLKAGMNDYLTKPLRSTLLNETLERWIAEVAAG